MAQGLGKANGTEARRELADPFKCGWGTDGSEWYLIIAMVQEAGERLRSTNRNEGYPSFALPLVPSTSTSWCLLWSIFCVVCC